MQPSCGLQRAGAVHFICILNKKDSFLSLHIGSIVHSINFRYIKSVLSLIQNQMHVLPWEPSNQKQWKDPSWNLLYGKKLSSSQDPRNVTEIKPLGYQ